MWGIFSRCSAFPEIRREPLDGAGDDAQAGGVVLLAVVEDHLGAEADPEDRFSALHPFPQMDVQAAFAEIHHRRPGGADAGKDDMAGVIQEFGNHW